MRKHAVSLILALVAAMVLALGGVAGVPIRELRRQERRHLLRLYDARALPLRPKWMLWAERRWHKTMNPVRLFIKYEPRLLVARILAAYSWITRPAGFEGYRMSYWRFYAIITLALRERTQRKEAMANGDLWFMGAGGLVLVKPKGGFASIPAYNIPVAGGAGITRVGQISPLYYKKVAGGLPVLQDLSVFPGNVFFVDSGTTVQGADTSGFGTNPDAPFLTVDFAIGQCTASQADVIFVLPGHYEDLAAAETIDADVQGISIVGVGRGPDRPEFVYDATDAQWDVGAHAVHMQNLLFQPSVALVVGGIDIETTFTDTFLEDLEAIPGEAGDGTDEFVDFILVAKTCDRTHIKGLLYAHHASAGGTQTAISLTQDSDRVHIEDFWIEGSGAAWVAGIQGLGTLSTRMLIEHGKITCDNEPGVELLTGTTGILSDIDIFSDLATIAAATVADGMAHFNVRYVEVGNESNAAVKTASVND
jgi:hypothetical protein